MKNKEWDERTRSEVEREKVEDDDYELNIAQRKKCE